MMWRWLMVWGAVVFLPGACSDDDDATTDVRGDVEVPLDTSSASDTDGDDVKGAPDTSTGEPGCETVSSAGFFADCSVCDAAGLDCDTFDIHGQVGHTCGCGAGGACPCGQVCGSVEIAPGITSSGECVAP